MALIVGDPLSCIHIKRYLAKLKYEAIKKMNNRQPDSSKME